MLRHFHGAREEGKAGKETQDRREDGDFRPPGSGLQAQSYPAESLEPRKRMTKEDLFDLLRKILNTDANLDFLSNLGPRELETLIACIRHRIEQEKKHSPSSGS
jgi:hypothetical protein